MPALQAEGEEAVTGSIRKAAKVKYGGRCGYCGEIPKLLHVDHVVPKAHGGTDDLSNLMPACGSCNNFKMTFSLEQFRHELSQQVLRARKYSINFRLAERFGQVEARLSAIIFHFEKESAP
jgi:5-methylcytosine-specific restriction endonuclease McrA